MNNLNILNDLNVWNIPARKACLRGEKLEIIPRRLFVIVIGEIVRLIVFGWMAE